MRFYTQQHPHYCGIDLHARTMYMCILDQAGAIVLHRNMQADPDSFLKAVGPYRDGIVVAVECIFTWYWLADVCAREKIAFVLGHALYMKAIHGGKAKNDKIDAYKIAVLLRGGMVAQAYVYPEEMRSTRDLLRRRMKLMQQRAQLLGHIQNTNSQYNLPVIEKQMGYKSNREGIAERFADSSVRANIGLDLKRIDFYDGLLREVEHEIVQQAKQHDARALELLDSVPGVGKILSLVLLYEIHDISRFPTVQDFSSYCRLVKSKKESAGKTYGYSGAKMGNATLKWAFSEAAVLFLRNNPPAQAHLARQAKIHGKGKALTMLAHKLARAVYYMLQRRETFNMTRFLNR